MPQTFGATFLDSNGDEGVANQRLVDEFKRLATLWGMPPSQLALAWVLHQAPHALPIPGARRIEYLRHNVTAQTLRLEPSQLEALAALFVPSAVRGARYPKAGWAGIEAAQPES
jgi:aryl-alcohol dehydrogenase-like predicted oxidoreductase